MRYIKTNEGLLTFKSEAKFDKILNELKSFLSEEGYIITEGDEEDRKKISFGRSAKSVIKTRILSMSGSFDNPGTKDEYNFILGIILVKEKNFESPFLHYTLRGSKNGHTESRDKLQIELSIDKIKESIIGHVSNIVKYIERKIELEGKELNFYKEFPPEDIKDYLLELFDIFGEYKISKESNLYVINFTDTFPKLNSIADSRISDSKLYNSSDMFLQLISEFNLLSKRLNSIGLNVYLDIESAACSGKILLIISELKK